MKKILISLLLVACSLVSVSQSLYNRWIPASGTDTYSTNITGLTAYANSVVYIKFANANTTTSTLNINSIGAATIRKWDGDSWEVLVSGDIDVNTVYKLSYSGSYYELEGLGSSGGGLTASSITNTPAGNIAATNVQDAINELDTEKQATISFGANVQTALGVAAGAAGGFWRDTDFMQSRTITGADDLDQTDNLRTVYANGSSDFDIAVDLLTAGSRVLVINVGTDTVTLVDGAGAAIVGGPVDIAPGQNAIVDYRIAATPEVYTGAAGFTDPMTTRGDLIIRNTSNITARLGIGTNGQILRSDGTDISWTTPPYYLLASGGTAPAANTFTHNVENGLSYAHTFTATANNSYARIEGGTLTARATASDNLIFKRLNPTLVASAATQSLILMDLQPTFTPGAFSPRQFSIRAASGDLLFGTNTPFATVTNYQFQASSGSNNVLRVTNSSGATSQLFRADGTLSIGNNLASIALTDASGLTESVTGTTFRLSNSASRNNTNDVQYLFLQGNDASTAATTHNVFRLVPNASSAFAPTSGSTNFRVFYLNPSVNQTGTASGTITLFDIEPTETGILGTYYSFLSRPVNARSGFATGTPVSTLDVDGSFGMDITSTSSDLTLTHIHHTVLVDASGANRTITLPAVSGAGRREYTVKKTDASGNTVTVDGNSSETIDGATTYVLSAQWEYVTFQTEGTAWYVTGNN